ncbi:MAG: GumC family protein [Planctomycetota bacterium]|jgi:uncharacterized protein involved in exopolysaccharide biosynthesis
MALQVDSQDQVQEILGVLSRRRWAIALPAVYVITLGVVLATFAPKRFKAEMQINLLEARVDDRDYDTRSLQESATLREIENAEHQARQAKRVQRVIDELNWPDYEQLDGVEKQEYISRVRSRIGVEVLQKSGNEGSTFVDLAYADVDRDRSVTFLERLTNLWVTEVYQRDAENLRQERETFRSLRDESKNEFERLERERRQLITDNDLTPAQVDGTIRGQEEDPVQVALNERRAELEDLEVDIGELSAEMGALQDLIDATPKEELTTVGGGASYEQSIAKLEAQMQTLLLTQDRYLPAHTEWQRIQDQLGGLEDQIDRLRDAARQVTVTQTPQLNMARVALVGQLDLKQIEMEKLVARRDRLSSLNDSDSRELETRINALGRIRELDAEIETAKANYRDAAMRLNETEQQLRVVQEAYAQPWEVTADAHTTENPTEPNVSILVIASVVLGLMLGVGLAIALEFLQGGFRTAADASRAIDLPVLGVVGQFQSRSERRSIFMRHAVMAFSTVLILGSIGWFTWTWANQPQLLGTGVIEAIESVRREFH